MTPQNNIAPNDVLQLDIVSDVICPWCYIGKRKLDQALHQVDMKVNLAWRPFQLDPTTPAEGVDRQQQMKRKFGEAQAKQIGKNIIVAAQGTGIEFAFDKQRRTPNTLNAHRLIRWAASTGQQHQVAESLFSRYFEYGEDVGREDVLLRIATEHNMDATLIAELLASDADIDTIRNDDARARDFGVSGVPAFLVAGKFMLMGAQDCDVLLNFFRKAKDKLAQQAQKEKTN